MMPQDIDLDAAEFSAEFSVDAAAPRGSADRLSYARHGKRLFDLAFALCLLPVLVPIIALLWLGVRRDGGAGFYGHRRVGRDGRSFRCWKIRTMVVDAEERLRRHLEQNPEAAAEWSREFKLRDDPRITRFGAFLRRTSLDELPQIWNVLRGEMSFVGPRPVVDAELARYGVHARTYASLRPGVTGLWQVSGRNAVSYDRRIDLDVAYANNPSLSGDLSILARTVSTVLRGTGC